MEMEAEPLPATPPMVHPPSRVRQRQQQPTQRNHAGPSPALRPGRSPREQKLRRITPKAFGNYGSVQYAKAETGPPSRSATTKLYSPTATQQPISLLPLTERRSQEDKHPPDEKCSKSSHDVSKLDITPDGGSAGREGRHFAVWNVGNNGRIYLRPTVRPPNQRYPQPNFVFPMTPPGTAGLDSLAKDASREEDTSLLLPEQRLTASRLPLTPTTTYLSETDALPRIRHRRAMSDSTVPDTSIARESDVGGFKIVITQPGDDQRPRTVEDMDLTKPSLLEISIPSWKLGTPRFSVRGTPFLRGSSYAPTEDVRSSSASVLNHIPGELTPGLSTARPSPLLGPPTPRSQTTPRLTPAFRSTFLSTSLRIEPAMFDALTFRPACDDRSIVRYSASTGAVTAATPPRLVAEITSPSFLDYDLLSDFFLTFRAFLDPTDLLRMLVARMRWALSQPDRETGTVVRVRTFVAVRHWILNYFLDDFVVDYSLRVTFCNLLNDFMDELSQDPDTNKAWLKILGELKRCWRRVCAQFWDGPDFDATVGHDQPITPGGRAGNRDPNNLDPSMWTKAEARPPQLDGILMDSIARGEGSLYGEVPRAGHFDATVTTERPATPENDEYEAFDKQQTSPLSMTSIDVISCSFPTKSTRMAQAGAHPLAPHPVDPSSVQQHADSIATTPRALMGKRVRPQHKRNGSLSDSLREPATMTEKLLYKNAEFLLTLPYAGSLVRGNLFPPGQAFVEVAPPSQHSGGAHRDTTVFEQSPTDSHKFRLPASAMSSQGMRRLLGSVRRALSTRGGEAVSPTHGSFFNISPIGPRGATTNRLPGTAIVPQARPRTNGFRPPVRIDLLGAEIAEDFKRAVREDAAAEAEKQHETRAASLPTAKVTDSTLETPVANLGSSSTFRPVSDMAITTGSKSIVIVDDTFLPSFPVMRGALPASNASVEAFAESFMPDVADPTPPTTPPGRPADTPRRSSYILGQPVIRPSLSADPLPPFVPDMATLGRGQSAGRPSQDTVPSTAGTLAQSPNRPPLSGRRGRGHMRHRSSRSLRSQISLNRLRRASFSPGIVGRPMIQSFDATTYSEGSVNDMSDVPVPQPLRVLRRRPGGDLRAVNKVGDLDVGPLRKSRSVGSLSTFTDSLRSSYIHSGEPDTSGFVDVGSSDFSGEATKPFSLGAIAEQNPKRELSLFSTHSSKPIMRPSFEAEAQKLAQIPDNPEDDGGVEAALLKLEGKYEKKPVISFVEPKAGIATSLAQETDETPTHVEVSKEEKLEHRHVQVEDEHILAPPGQLSTVSARGQSWLAVPSVLRSNDDGQSFLSDDSRGSYSSTPLLERGLTDEARSRKTATQEWTDRSILQGPEEETPIPHEQNPLDSQHPSYDFVKKTESMERIQPGQTLPADSDVRQSTEQSFLDVESDDDTDLSSEMSLEFVGSNEDDDLFPPLKHTTTTITVRPVGKKPSEVNSQSGLPERRPSSPISLAQALHMGPPNTLKIPEVHEHQLWDEKPLPPTPDTTPTTVAAPYSIGVSSQSDPTGTREALRNAPTLDIPDPVPQQNNDAPRNKYSVHLPFILAFDSEVLAQQFTLVEKDALNEIDWKDLIDMKWKNAEQKGTNTRSWVSFLRDTDARGVEVVIARFNIMVKWAVSECVLTQDLEERARCIIKYIHIARHCRRYRNYATASQLTIALTSPEVSRLTKTWALVPPADIKTLRDLEALISPTRNFYNLRREMEGGGNAGAASTDIGCIPFVGIYTHDLLFNAQRPSEIASSPTTAPLVNFERCRMAAGVVKTLLRLLEASSNYNFQPIEGVTERCLWMSALSDEEMRKLADSLD